MRRKQTGTTGILLCVLLFVSLLFYMPYSAKAQETKEINEIIPSELYAQSAVLMDADSGRILFAKNGQEERAMASTTKIMTCILALEEGSLSDLVSVTEEASSQPQVKLGMTAGQSFYLEDLLYSLMLESHNDSAVAIAEHIGGSVEGFAGMMNRKAKELQCLNTYFITPNGLDADDEHGTHHTTAEDLARIMKYCILDSDKSDAFLEITRTPAHSFSDAEGNRSYSCTNHNSFLNMMEGALSGKTGFTADAGYCYVGALRQDERTFIVSLLACGWPNNKGYKWSDTRKLMSYGLENYHYQEIKTFQENLSLSVEGGLKKGFPDSGAVTLGLTVKTAPFRILLRDDEEIETEYEMPDRISAPVAKGERLGTVTYSLHGAELKSYPIYASEGVKKRTFLPCFSYIVDIFLL